MAEQIHLPLRVLDANGDPVSGAKLVFTESGTDTALTVYSDEALSTTHDDPLEADGGGYPGQAFYSGSPAARLRIYTADDTLLHDLDPVPSSGVEESAAGVSFSPVTGNSAVTVQAGIANNTAAIVAADKNYDNASTVVVTAGTDDAYTVTATSTITEYEIGTKFLIRPDRANTGAATIDVDSVGAVDLQKYDNTGTLAALAAGDLAIGRIYEISFDGTRFILTSPPLATDTVAGVVELSDSTENATGTDTSRVPSVAGVVGMLDARLVAGGRFNGTGTPAWDFNYGFSATITDNGTGDYTVAFGTAQDDANYIVLLSILSPGAGDLQRVWAYPYSLTTSGFSIRTNETTTGQADYDDIQVMVFRLGWL